MMYYVPEIHRHRSGITLPCMFYSRSVVLKLCLLI